MSARRKLVVVIVIVAGLVAGLTPGWLVASDHDDGENDQKARSLNLTDLYLFREIDQSPNNAPSSDSLIFIMNTNPRSVARQQYYFSTQACYEFKIARGAGANAPVTGVPDVILRFEFGAPSGASQQELTVTAIRDGAVTTAFGGPFRTTPLGAANPMINAVSLGGTTLHVFAGLREDPFFFDVEQFFRVRGGALGLGPAARFRTPGLDFTAGYNVNAIVARVPRAFLQGGTLPAATTFDVWETISLKSPGGTCDTATPIERLAQPAINEGLIRTNDFLNTLNAVTPADELAILTGPGLGHPILAEAASTLLAFGNTVGQAVAIATAFLPDVMRIDTLGPSGYAGAVNAAGRPVRGRKITDDVIDITLSVLVPGSNVQLERDNVSYRGPNRGETRHQDPLPAFPYLAAPN